MQVKRELRDWQHESISSKVENKIKVRTVSGKYIFFPNVSLLYLRRFLMSGDPDFLANSAVLQRKHGIKADGTISSNLSSLTSSSVASPTLSPRQSSNHIRIQGEFIVEETTDDINDAAYDVMRDMVETGDTEEVAVEGVPDGNDTY